MSRILASIVITVIIISLCIVERVEVNSIISDSRKYINQMMVQYNDKTKVKKTAEEFNGYWKQKEKILCLFYADSELHTISIDIASLPFLSKLEDEFLHSCNDLDNRFILLKEHSTRFFG